MKDSLIEKLKKELEKNTFEECQVVYILSRIRKILEIKNQKQKYKYLDFYGNWILHGKLDLWNPLCDLFEKDIDIRLSGKEITQKIKSHHSEFFKLKTLKQELDIFFKEYKLPIDYLNKNWAAFLIHLLEIIRDTPILFRSGKLRQLELINNAKNEHCYKFHLRNSKEKPIVKLKLK